MLMNLSEGDLRLLRVFAKVVEAGGFSAAQIELNVSQSTISTHMTALEQRLGMRLCERGRSGFRDWHGRACLRRGSILRERLGDCSVEPNLGRKFHGKAVLRQSDQDDRSRNPQKSIHSHLPVPNCYDRRTRAVPSAQYGRDFTQTYRGPAFKTIVLATTRTRCCSDIPAARNRKLQRGEPWRLPDMILARSVRPTPPSPSPGPPLRIERSVRRELS